MASAEGLVDLPAGLCVCHKSQLEGSGLFDHLAKVVQAIQDSDVLWHAWVGGCIRISFPSISNMAQGCVLVAANQHEVCVDKHTTVSKLRAQAEGILTKSQEAWGYAVQLPCSDSY